MHHFIFLIIAMMLSASFAHAPPYAVTIVSFAEGGYDPSIIKSAGGVIIGELRNVGMIHAVVPQSALAGLAKNPAVEFVEGDRHFQVAQADTSVEYSSSWGLTEIGAEPVHLSEYTGKGVKIGVLDTGIDYNHPELAPSYKGGHDFINGDSDPMDDNGHGTHVAGILAAARDGRGVVGVAPDAEIYALKVSDENGKGSFSGLAKGIDWSIENGMDIVTMSITGTGGSKALKKAVETAYSHNMVLVAAVGNGGSGSVLYPAAYEQVIGVGSVTKEGALSSFSRTGSEVELVAPGSGIRSTGIGGGYRSSSGTSMATPFVTGAIALLLGSDERAWAGMADGDGRWTNDEIRNVLGESARDLGKDGKDDSFGYGLLSLDFPHGQPGALVAASVEEEPEPADSEPVLLKLAWYTLRITLRPVA